MKRFLILATACVLGLFAVGCSDRPQVNPQDVKRVDPLAVPGQPAGTPAAEPGGQVALTRNFYIVFDGSGSMRGERLERAKQAVRTFVPSLPDDVNVGLFVFDYYGESERVKLGPNNKDAVLKAVEKVYADNGTPLGAAIRTGRRALVEQYKAQLGYGDYRLVVITDGAPDSMSDMEAAVQECAQAGIPICTIGIDIGPSHALRRFSLSYKDTRDAAQLTEALKEAVGELDTFDNDSFKK